MQKAPKPPKSPKPLSYNVIESVELEQYALRQHGLLGHGRGPTLGAEPETSGKRDTMAANQLHAMDITSLPREAHAILQLIIRGGPFPYPGKDGSTFGDRIGDLPGGTYSEFTVPTPGLKGRGRRRLVVRHNGMLFFTACHYERVHVTGGQREQREPMRRAKTQELDPEYRNGFYVVTGTTAEYRNQLRDAVTALARSRRRILEA